MRFKINNEFEAMRCDDEFKWFYLSKFFQNFDRSDKSTNSFIYMILFECENIKYVFKPSESPKPANYC